MRAATSSANLIDVHALRVGMFVHLDLGWISHPFPLNSFKITSPQQVETIRALGLERVRWNPEQSDHGLLDSRPGDARAVDGSANDSVAGRAPAPTI